MGVTADSDGGGRATGETTTRTTDLGIDGLSGAVHLGAGGSANVYAARILDTGAEVAVKLLRASADSDKERQRFEREQETLQRLSNHDGIVPVLDAGVTDREEPYFLMPLMEGSLQDRIDSTGALDWQTATQLVVDVADAVSFAHEEQVLHRDLKPGNILLDEGGVPRVADFGIAKMVDSNVSKSSKSLGTPSFMPPERFNGEEATEATDVYGLAATLSALITGSAPFLTGENDTDVAVMMRVVTEDPPSLEGHDVPEEISEAVQAAMAKKPDDRPTSVAEFAATLRLALDPHLDPAMAGPVTIAIPRRNLTIPDGPATASRAATMEVDPTADADDSNKKKWLVPLAAAVFTLIIGAGAALAMTGGDEGDQTAVDVETTDDESVDDATSADDDAAADPAADEEKTDGDDGDPDVSTDIEGAGEAAVDGAVVDGDGDEDSGDNALGGAGDGTGDAGDTGGGDTGDTGGGDTGDTGGGDTGDTGGDTGDTGDDKDEPPIPDPDACFTPSTTTVETGDWVTFTNCSSHASSYSWDLAGSTSREESPRTSWSTAGRRQVVLTATGSNGATDTAQAWITVEQPPTPNACFTASTYTIDEGDTVSFSNCSTHATSYWWEFGTFATSSQESPSQTFHSAGTYTVTLTARGDGSDQETRSITVNAPQTPDPRVKPGDVSCATPAEGQWIWTWSSLPSWVNDYLVQFEGGSTESVGKQPAPYQTTRRVNAIIAVDKNNIQSPTYVSVGADCPEFEADAPAVPSGVSCRFSNFRGSGDTWTETWYWTDDPEVTKYQVQLNDWGSYRTIDADARGRHTTFETIGRPDEGVSVRRIIAVGPGGTSYIGLNGCGPYDYDNTWGSERAAAGF